MDLPGYAVAMARSVASVVLARHGFPVRPRPFMLYLSVAGRCNIACASCGVEDARLLRSGEAELTDREIVRVIREASSLGCRVLSIAGGEPLLRKGLVGWIKAASSLGMRVHMNTNGMLLDEKTARLLGQAGLFSVSLSIDHDDPVINDRFRARGAFHLAVRAIELFRRFAPRVRIIINCTVGHQNVDRMLAITCLSRDLKVDMLKFTPLDTNLQHRFRPSAKFEDLLLTPTDALILRDQVEQLLSNPTVGRPVGNSQAFLRGMYKRLTSRVRTRCVMGFLTITINAWGDVSGCFEIPSRRNIRDSTLPDIWNSSEYASVRHNVRTCDRECWDIGSAEPSLLLDLHIWGGKFSSINNAWRIIGGTPEVAV